MGDTPDIKKQFENTLNDVVDAGNELLNKNNTFHEKVEDELQEIDDKLVQLKEKFASVLSDIGHLNHEKRENNNKIFQLNERIKKLTAENGEQQINMAAAIEKHKTEIDELKLQLTNAQSSYNELKKSGDASEAEKKNIEANRVKIQNKIDIQQNDLEQKILDNEALEQKILEHNTKIIDLQKQNENIDGLLDRAIKELNKIMKIIDELSTEKKYEKNYEKIDSIQKKLNELLADVTPTSKFFTSANTDTKITPVSLDGIYPDTTDGVIPKPDDIIPENIVKERVKGIEREDNFPLKYKIKTVDEIMFDDMKKIKESSFKEGEQILFTENGEQKKGTVQSITLDSDNNKERNYSVIDNIGNVTSGLTEDKLEKVSNETIDKKGGKKKTRKNKTAKRKKRVTKKKRGSNKKSKKFTQRKKR